MAIQRSGVNCDILRITKIYVYSTGGQEFITVSKQPRLQARLSDSVSKQPHLQARFSDSVSKQPRLQARLSDPFVCCHKFLHCGITLTTCCFLAELCEPECVAGRGYCNASGRCQCYSGWRGRHCNECIPNMECCKSAILHTIPQYTTHYIHTTILGNTFHAHVTVNLNFYVHIWFVCSYCRRVLHAAKRMLLSGRIHRNLV